LALLKIAPGSASALSSDFLLRTLAMPSDLPAAKGLALFGEGSGGFMAWSDLPVGEAILLFLEMRF
jgi:hypothetical protein